MENGYIASETQFQFCSNIQSNTSTISPQFNQSVNNVMAAVSHTLAHSALSPFTQVRGVIVHGMPGCGKTAVLKEFCSQHKQSLYLSANEFYLTNPSDLLASKSLLFLLFCVICRDIKLVCFDDVCEASFGEE